MECTNGVQGNYVQGVRFFGTRFGSGPDERNMAIKRGPGSLKNIFCLLLFEVIDGCSG